jgi:predicted metal-binding protein
MPALIEEIGERLYLAGVHEYGTVSPADVEFTQEVRDLCEVNKCGLYGKTWACPPAVGTVEECRERCLRYTEMLVFSGKYDIARPFDYNGMKRGMQDFRRVAHRAAEIAREYWPDFLLLANEGCDGCEKCTYPAEPCRFPERSHGAIEGYGIYVFKLARLAGLRYDNGALTITFFGALLYS